MTPKLQSDIREFLRTLADMIKDGGVINDYSHVAPGVRMRTRIRELAARCEAESDKGKLAGVTVKVSAAHLKHKRLLEQYITGPGQFDENLGQIRAISDPARMGKEWDDEREGFSYQFRLWSNSWVIPLLKELVPELRPKKTNDRL